MRYKKILKSIIRYRSSGFHSDVIAFTVVVRRIYCSRYEKPMNLLEIRWHKDETSGLEIRVSQKIEIESSRMSGMPRS